MTNADQALGYLHVRSLMEYAFKNTYAAKSTDVEGEAILNNCITLFAKDYKYSVIDNLNGELCGHYPTKIIVLEYTTHGREEQQNNVQSMYDMDKLQSVIKVARRARCRGRFVAPVILYEGKHICRSATLSGGAEIYGRRMYGMLVSSEEEPQVDSAPSTTPTDSSDWQMFSIVRSQDIKLLKMLDVGFIFDLMVEKKKVKFGVNVTSSEKVDKENRYCDFSISSIPYPGCEFFREWKDALYQTEGMVYDWKQGFVDAQLDIPTSPRPPDAIDWEQYMSWDVVRLTQNYLLLLLHYIKEAKTGILVHCISGWDRTPLFVSLIRLSLWAEGLIHESLSAAEILYLTIAYDWFLFGHNFTDRFWKGEEIFHFCFAFLKYITGDEFNIGHRKTRLRTVSSPEYITDGALLDFDGGSSPGGGIGGCGQRASNTSLNSISSTRSNNDNPPFSFNVGSYEEDNFINSVQNNAQHTPSSKGSSPCGKLPVLADAADTRRTTSPMAVPKPVQHLSTDARSSFNSYGSWQFIPELESLRTGHTSSLGNPTSTNARLGSLSEIAGRSGTESSTTRKRNLDEVQCLFQNLYSSIMSESSNSWLTSSGGGISGFIGNFVEKVGFRSARSTFV